MNKISMMKRIFYIFAAAAAEGEADRDPTAIPGFSCGAIGRAEQEAGRCPATAPAGTGEGGGATVHAFVEKRQKKSQTQMRSGGWKSAVPVRSTGNFCI